MSFYDHPIQNPREYPCGPPRQYRGEPAKCPLWVLIVTLAVFALLYRAAGPEQTHKAAAMPERTAGR